MKQERFLLFSGFMSMGIVFALGAWFYFESAMVALGLMGVFIVIAFVLSRCLDIAPDTAPDTTTDVTPEQWNENNNSSDDWLDVIWYSSLSIRDIVGLLVFGLAFGLLWFILDSGWDAISKAWHKRKQGY